MSESEDKKIVEEKQKKNRRHRYRHWADKQIHQHNLFYLVGVAIILFSITTATAALIPDYSVYTTPPSYRAHPYTAEQQAGRDIYMQLGCFYCHSQQSREWDYTGYNVSLIGDFAYDQPHALGTERTGPDLAQIGGHRPTFWEYTHHIDPRQLAPNSIMPNFGFLSAQQLTELTAYIDALGSYDLNTYNFVPQAPEQFQNKSNPFTPLMMQVNASTNWDPTQMAYVFSGTPEVAEQWATIFDHGKELFAQHCITCHGCSGNGEGPYARTTVTSPANLHERISRYPGDFFHFYRVHEGVPGSYMPDWGKSLSDQDIYYIMAYEMSFSDMIGHRAIRTIPGDTSDAEGDAFNNRTQVTPIIAGTFEDFQTGKGIYNLYCAQCHGTSGQADGPASNNSRYGYILPEPANFTESGGDFPDGDYGRWLWKATQGVETTNMPPWKWDLNDKEIAQAVFYVQSFSTPDDYNTKWAPYYNDLFAKNLMTYLPNLRPASSAVSPSMYLPNVGLATMLIIAIIATLIARNFVVTKNSLRKPSYPQLSPWRLNKCLK